MDTNEHRKGKINHRATKEHREDPDFNHGWTRIDTDEDRAVKLLNGT